MTTKKKVVQDVRVERGPNFYDSVINVFAERNCRMVHKYKVQ
jgi:hypothetical protein